MFEYLIINLLTIIFPLIFTFHKKIKFYKNLKAVLISLLVVSGIYIVWDIFATDFGHWEFNEEFVSGFKILNLPIEEVLFFVTIPYSCLFLYELTNRWIKDRKIKFNKKIQILIGILFFILGLFSTGQYTMIVLFSVGLFFIIHYLINSNMLNSLNFWRSLGICFVGFLLVNFFLTSLPIVIYGEEFNLGIRIITIPIEDFFYNFSMLSFYFLVYRVNSGQG